MADQKQYKKLIGEDNIITPNLEISPEDSQRAYLNILEDMQAERLGMEDQRKATFNIMEDITEAQEELKYKYKHTQVLRDLIQRLTITIDPKDIMENMLKSFEELLDFDAVSFVIGEHKTRKDASSIYIYAKTLIGRSYLESTRRAFLEYLDSIPQSIINVEGLKIQIRKRMYYEFIKGSMSGDEELGRRPLNGFVVPLLIKEEKASSLLGVFYISTFTPQIIYSQQQIEIASDIANVVSFNIERINTMIRSEYSRMSNLVDSMTNGVVVFNQSRVVTLANPVIERMTGLPCSSSSSSLFRLEEFTRLFPEIDLNDMTSSVLKTGFSLHVEEAKISRFFYEMFITPVRNWRGDISGGAIIMHDITHMKEIDRMKTEFVSVASHQLRTPLTAIKLFIEMLQKGDAGKLTKKQNEYIDDVSTSTERMIRLVNDLLNVSRLETGRLKIEPTSTNIEKFLTDLVKESLPLCKQKRCRILFENKVKKIDNLMIDKTLFRQVILNLITNAIRYSQDRGKIVISLQQLTTDNLSVTAKGVQMSNVKDQWLISVADQGIGIPKKVQDRIFEKFFRADNAQKAEAEGSGLGLYVVKMIVKAYGGKIWFDSEEGKGTTFYVTIPRKGMNAKKGEKGIAK